MFTWVPSPLLHLQKPTVHIQHLTSGWSLPWRGLEEVSTELKAQVPMALVTATIVTFELLASVSYSTFHTWLQCAENQLETFGRSIV